MALLNSYIGLILVVFGSLISTFMVISRIKSARYEQESRAQWDALRKQQQATGQETEALRDQVANVLRFQNKSSKVLLDHIGRNAQAQQKTANEQQQYLQELLNLEAAGTEAIRTLQEQINTDREQVQSVLGGKSDTLSELISKQALVYDAIARIEEHTRNTSGLHESLQQHTKKTEGRITAAAYHTQALLNELHNAADSTAADRHQTLTDSLQKLEGLSTRQFESVAEQQDTIKDALMQLGDDKKTVLSGVKVAAQSLEKSIANIVGAAEESLQEAYQALAAELQQLSEDVDQQTAVATERNVSAVMDAYENLQSLFESEINAVHGGLQTISYNIDNATVDAEEHYYTAINIASEQIQNRLIDDNNAVLSSLQTIEHAVHAIENRVSQ